MVVGFAVIFVSNPTTVLRLCCVVVGVVTKLQNENATKNKDEPKKEDNLKNRNNKDPRRPKS